MQHNEFNQTNGFHFTEFTNTARPYILGKEKWLNPDGTLGGRSHGVLYKGTATTRRCGDLREFRDRLLNLDKSKAIGIGVKPDLPEGESVEITSKANVVAGVNYTRSKDIFVMSEGEAIVVNDFDFHLREGAIQYDLQGLDDAFIDLIPEAAGCERLLLRSTSAGIVMPDGSVSTSGGIHLYIRLKHGTDLPAFRELVHVRSWAKGYGYYMTSKSGAKLERELFDQSVYSPERLIFEARPVLGAGLTQLPRETLYVAGGAL